MTCGLTNEEDRDRSALRARIELSLLGVSDRVGWAGVLVKALRGGGCGSASLVNEHTPVLVAEALAGVGPRSGRLLCRCDVWAWRSYGTHPPGPGSRRPRARDRPGSAGHRGRPPPLCRRSAAYARPCVVCRSRHARAGTRARSSLPGRALRPRGLLTAARRPAAAASASEPMVRSTCAWTRHAASPVSAWLARAGLDEIRQVIATLGEERFARRVAQAIVNAREQAPLTADRRSSPRSWPARCARASPASTRRPARSRRCACSSTMSSASSSRVSLQRWRS